MTLEMIAVLVLLAFLGFPALKWAFWPRRSLPGHRVRYQRLRLHLRLHPGHGHATAFELFRHWGRLASARKTGMRVRR